MIQGILKEKGFYSGTVDGSWGKLTTTSINEWKKSIGWKENGKIGVKGLKKLLIEL